MLKEPSNTTSNVKKRFDKIESSMKIQQCLAIVYENCSLNSKQIYNVLKEQELRLLSNTMLNTCMGHGAKSTTLKLSQKCKITAKCTHKCKRWGMPKPVARPVFQG